jgi:hypothetical protein
MDPNKSRLILSGVVATVTLTVLMYAGPLAGFPKIDMAAAIGGFLDQPAIAFSARWWVGLGVFLAVGMIVSPLLFMQVGPSLYGSGWLRGLEWGVILWVFGGVCVMFNLGLAFHEPFVTHPQLSTAASFLGNLIYGAVLGALAARSGSFNARSSPV